MTKIIAIHNGSGGFHPRWAEYCKRNEIPFKIVNCYANDFIAQLQDCKGLLWHHSQNDPKALLASKPILFALEQAGIKVFPDFNTNWHFDDKLGQKYLLEAIGAPLVPTYAFYDKKTAFEWAGSTTFPKVFKLRGGAGSSNVKLIKSKKEAFKIIRKAFGRGFPNYDEWANLKEILRKWRLGKANNLDLIKGIARMIIKPQYSLLLGKEKGYALFQDFIPGNDHDIRIIVINDKAFAIKRMVRHNDFRASGSGNILYEKHHFNEEVIKLAFKIHKDLKSQCTAMDFVFYNDIPKIIEISYGFDPKGYEKCTGYWSSDICWHEGKINPYGWMVDLMINE